MDPLAKQNRNKSDHIFCCVSVPNLNLRVKLKGKKDKKEEKVLDQKFSSLKEKKWRGIKEYLVQSGGPDLRSLFETG